ncbi:hypothetical protein G7Y89_g6532 [Cudoniella acicularis]|uniref:Kinesin light chain n=1 Tax=Cudoniella acicularis TaxID=354080 RepID=A0A8H4RKB0_9HELO|nr:hypothetical protein G7Y89_g6532 [Cudoniella acicularis]
MMPRRDSKGGEVSFVSEVQFKIDADVTWYLSQHLSTTVVGQMYTFSIWMRVDSITPSSTNCAMFLNAQDDACHGLRSHDYYIVFHLFNDVPNFIYLSKITFYPDLIDNSTTITPNSSRDIAYHVTRERYNAGDYPTSTKFDESLTTSWTRINALLSRTHSMEGKYGMYLYKDGRWNEAEAAITEVLEIQKRDLGADSPDTLTSMGNLALTYRNQGPWDAAEELEVQVLEASKTKLRADHPDTLTSMANLAFTWKEQGRDKEAVKLIEECVMLQTRIIGANHHNTLSSCTTLLKWQTEELEINTSVYEDLDV